MRETIWTVRDADGELRGVGMGGEDAVNNAYIDKDTRDAFHLGCPSPHNGYTVAREALTPSPAAATAAQAQPVAWALYWANGELSDVTQDETFAGGWHGNEVGAYAVPLYAHPPAVATPAHDAAVVAAAEAYEREERLWQSAMDSRDHWAADFASDARDAALYDLAAAVRAKREGRV